MTIGVENSESYLRQKKTWIHESLPGCCKFARVLATAAHPGAFADPSESIRREYTIFLAVT